MSVSIKEYTKILKKEEEGQYIYIPIEIEKGAERLEINYDYIPWRPKGSAWKNDIDVIVTDDTGEDVGTRGSAIRDIVISPYYSTPGYDTRNLTPGIWNVVVLLARMISDEVDFKVVVKTYKKERKWYVGDTHTHTINSDGNLRYDQLINRAKETGMDYLFITDHNRTIVHMPKSVDYLTVIPGLELTYPKGHANVWGLQKPYSGTVVAGNQEHFLKLKAEAEKNGALVSINHPMCTKCGFRWPLDNFDFGVVEVWNGPMRLDNLKAIDWWDAELRKGRRLSAVGGSDFHKDYGLYKLFGKPVNYVYAEGRAKEDIMKGICEGRTSMSANIKSTFLDITCGESIIGDTVKYSDELTVKVTAKKLKRGHFLIVYDNTGEIFRYKARKKGDYSFDIPVKTTGFIRADVRYKMRGIKKFLFNIGLLFALPEQAFMKEIPPMVESLCGPIWFA